MSVPVYVTQEPSAIASTTQPLENISISQSQSPPFFVIASAAMALLVIVLIIYGKLQIKKLNKKIRFEQFRNRELEKKFKLALETIRKMETNPDLINSREFNLDYLRMRMGEEVFHFAIVNQLKIKVKNKITESLRSNTNATGIVGIASNGGRQIDEIFDVEYETGTPPDTRKRILFRIQIRLMKLPTQTTSATISQIIDCIETYLSPVEDRDTWQPTIQGRIAFMQWDQKAKPTPLLVLEQSNEGVNVTFRTRKTNTVTPPPPPQNRQSRSRR